jgi:hypothetical protein
MGSAVGALPPLWALTYVIVETATTAKLVTNVAVLRVDMTAPLLRFRITERIGYTSCSHHTGRAEGNAFSWLF